MSKPETSSKERVNLKELAIRTLLNFLLKEFLSLTLATAFSLNRNIRLIDFNSCLTPLVCIMSRRKTMYNEITD